MAKVFYNLKVKICNIFQKDRRGAILIEFAFSIPVLITCLYYAIDVPQAFRLSNKAYLISELYAQCVFNLLESRADKKINAEDLKNLSKLMGCCITGGANNVDLKGIKIVIDIKGQGYQPSSLGVYFWYPSTGRYEKISDWWKKVRFKSGFVIVGEEWCRQYSRKTVTSSYEVSTTAQKQLIVECKNTNNKLNTRKIIISTSITSDKLFYMMPLKSIGKQKSVTVNLPAGIFSGGEETQSNENAKTESQSKNTKAKTTGDQSENTQTGEGESNSGNEGNQGDENTTVKVVIDTKKISDSDNEKKQDDENVTITPIKDEPENIIIKLFVDQPEDTTITKFVDEPKNDNSYSRTLPDCKRTLPGSDYVRKTENSSSPNDKKNN